MSMKRLLFLLFSAAVLLMYVVLASCSKVTQSELNGNWYVDSIEVQEITSNTDSGWRPQQGIMAIFAVKEVLSISKSHITPCPSCSASLTMYDNYSGQVKYTLSGSKITIPDQQYSYVRMNGEQISEVGETTIQGGVFDVDIDNGEMDLSGTMESTDNLGNVKKRTNIQITLHKL